MKNASDDITIKTEITMKLVRNAFYADLEHFEKKLHNYKQLIEVIQEKNTKKSNES